MLKFVFTAVCLNDILCKFPEDCDNAETCRSYVMEKIYRMQNCVFVVVTAAAQ